MNSTREVQINRSNEPFPAITLLDEGEAEIIYIQYYPMSKWWQIIWCKIHCYATENID